MALYVILYDRPADVDGAGYRERAKDWIAAVTKLDGFVEVAAYWNALHTSPNTMVQARFASPEAALRALAHPEHRDLFADMRRHGCTNIAAFVFESSQVTPEPVRR